MNSMRIEFDTPKHVSCTLFSVIYFLRNSKHGQTLITKNKLHFCKKYLHLQEKSLSGAKSPERLSVETKLTRICITTLSLLTVPLQVASCDSPHPQQALLSLAEGGISGEGFSHFVELVNFPGSCLCIHATKPLFHCLLLVYFMSV